VLFLNYDFDPFLARAAANLNRKLKLGKEILS
jgi:hypothetical protein